MEIQKSFDKQRPLLALCSFRNTNKEILEIYNITIHLCYAFKDHNSTKYKCH